MSSFVLGADDSLTLLVMEFLPADSLKSLAASSKTIFDLLSVDLAVKSCLYSGGYCMESVLRLGDLIRKGAIYPLSPMRILQLCTSRVCEHCASAKTNKVRASFGILVCWHCLTKGREVPSGSASEPLTRNIHKFFWSDRFNSYTQNQCYFSKRSLFRRIFDHTRILAYPCGTRYLEATTDPHDCLPVLVGPFNYEHTTTPVAQLTPGTRFASKDRKEVVYAKRTIDLFGDPSGPVIAYEQIMELVSYLSEEGNEGIDYYLNNIMSGVPSMSEYSPFLQAFDANVERALARWQAVKQERAAFASLKRFRSIQVGMDCMGKIATQMTSLNIKRWCENVLGLESRTPDYYERQSIVFSRMVLLYHEIPYIHAKWTLTYDTGCPQLNRTLHRILGPYLKNPKRMPCHVASALAEKIFIASRSTLLSQRVPGIFENGNRGRILDGFGQHFRTRYANNPDRKFPVWSDTSDNRRL